MPELRSEFLMELRAELDEPLVVAGAPLCSRRIKHTTRGTFVGPRLTGDLLPGGGNWVLLRPDGVAELDIRFTLRTDDGALIYLMCDGLFDIEPAVRQRIASSGRCRSSRPSPRGIAGSTGCSRWGSAGARRAAW